MAERYYGPALAADAFSRAVGDIFRGMLETEKSMPEVRGRLEDINRQQLQQLVSQASLPLQFEQSRTNMDYLRQQMQHAAALEDFQQQRLGLEEQKAARAATKEAMLLPVEVALKEALAAQHQAQAMDFLSLSRKRAADISRGEDEDARRRELLSQLPPTVNRENIGDWIRILSQLPSFPSGLSSLLGEYTKPVPTPPAPSGEFGMLWKYYSDPAFRESKEGKDFIANWQAQEAAKLASQKALTEYRRRPPVTHGQDPYALTSANIQTALRDIDRTARYDLELTLRNEFGITDVTQIPGSYGDRQASIEWLRRRIRNQKIDERRLPDEYKTPLGPIPPVLEKLMQTKDTRTTPQRILDWWYRKTTPLPPEATEQYTEPPIASPQGSDPMLDPDPLGLLKGR